MRGQQIIIVALSLLAASLSAEELPIPADKEIIEFQTKIGSVTFLHKMHAGMDITECTTCHHKLQPEDTVVQPCHECHLHEAESEKEEDPPKTKIAFHTRCTGCHQYTIDQGMEAGPVRKKCKLCHIKPDKK